MFEENGHRVDGSGKFTHNYTPLLSSSSLDAGLNYIGPKADASFDINHADIGTSIRMDAKGNFYESRNHRARLDGNVQYYSLLGSLNRPDIAGGLKFLYKFD